MNVGKLDKLSAWVDKMPIGGPTLHVTGTIVAPDPCHEPYGVYIGDIKTNPPVFQLEIRFSVKPGLCSEVLTSKDFHYVEHNFAGTHKEVEVSSSSDNQRVKIEVAV